MKLVKESLYEALIIKDKIEINIDYGISTTQHSKQRQNRHAGDYISNEEISANVKGAFEQITDNLLFDNLDIGERVLIKNKDSNLNIVGVPTNGGENIIIFKIITVMRHPSFRNPKETKIIRISNKDLSLPKKQNFFQKMKNKIVRESLIDMNMRAKLVNENLNQYGSFNSTLFLFKKNDYKDFNLWLEYNGLSHTNIKDVIDKIYDLFGAKPYKIHAYLQHSESDNKVAIIQFDDNENRVEIEFDKNGSMDIILVNVYWDGKQMNHRLLDSIKISNTSELNKISHFFKK